MKINELFLMESTSDIVYHYTRIYNAIQIAKSNRFELSPGFSGVEGGISGSRLFFMSLSRNRTGQYHASATSGVLFILDGRLLSQRYKSMAVDYWGPEYKKTSFEQEDRLVSDMGAIPNAKNYILRADILTNDVDSDMVNILVNELGSVPHRIYTNRNQWIIGGRDFIINEPRSVKHSHDDHSAMVGNFLGMVLGIIEKIKNKGQLSFEQKRFYSEFLAYPYLQKTFIMKLEYDINMNHRESITALASYMRQNRLKNTQELAVHLSDTLDYLKK